MKSEAQFSKSVVAKVLKSNNLSYEVYSYIILFVYCLPFVLFLPSGVILRDSHGVAQTRHVAGNKILRILKAKGLAPTIPEDLYFLIKKAVAIRKHLERNRKVRHYL